MAFSQAAREREWSDWYSQHLGVLLSVPGFTTAQRFQSIAPCRAPYLAAYSVASGDVFESAEYRSRGGRASPGEWVPLMINWDRNLFDGLIEMPEVAPDELLAVLDGSVDEIARCAWPMQTLRCAGLDHTVASRGVAVLSSADYAAATAKLGVQADNNLRFYRSLTPQLRAAR